MGYFDDLLPPGSAATPTAGAPSGGGYFDDLLPPPPTAEQVTVAEPPPRQAPVIPEPQISGRRSTDGFRKGVSDIFRRPDPMAVNPSVIPGNSSGPAPYVPGDKVSLPKHILSELEIGAAQGTAGTMKAIPRLMRMIENTIPPIGIIANGGLEPWMQSMAKPPQTVEEEMQRHPLTQAADLLVEANKEDWKRDRDMVNDPILGSLPRTVGGLVPTLAAGLAGRLAKAGTLPSIFQSSTAAASDVADEATAAGRPDLAQEAFGIALPAVAASQALLGVPEKFFKATASPGWRGAARSFATGTASEGGQEGVEQIWNNLNARLGAGYDPYRHPLANVPESAGMGALIGGPVNVVGNLNSRQRAAMELDREMRDAPMRVPDERTLIPEANRLTLPAEQGTPQLGRMMDSPSDIQSTVVEADPSAPPYQRAPITDPSRLISRHALPVPDQFTHPDPIIDRWLREQYFRRQEGPSPEKRPMGQEVPVLPAPGIPVTDREDVVVPFRRRAQQQLLLPETTSEGSTSVVDEPYDPNATATAALMDMESRAARRARLQARSNAAVNPPVNVLPARVGPAEPMPVAWPVGSSGPPTRLSSNLPLPRGPMFSEDQNPKPQPGSVIPQQPATVADGSRTPLPEEQEGQPVKKAKAVQSAPAVEPKPQPAPVAVAPPAPVLQPATTPATAPKVKSKNVSRLRAITGQKPVGVPLTEEQRLAGSVVEDDASLPLKTDEQRTPKEKLKRSPSELRTEEIEWWSKQGTPKPNTMFGRLHDFIAVGVRQATAAAMFGRKGENIPSDADAKVMDALTSAAIRYAMKHGEFDIAKGKFSPSRSAQLIIQNAIRDNWDMASMDQEKPDDSGETVGSSIKDDIQDPARKLEIREGLQALNGLLPGIYDEVVASLETTDQMQAASAVWHRIIFNEEVKLTAFGPKVRAIISDPKFEKKITAAISRAFVKLATAEESAAVDALHSIRHSATDATGPAMTPEQVRVAAEEFIGGPLSENIRVVTDTTGLTPNGKNWDARFVSGPDGWVIELNSAFLHSPQQVQSAMLHEGLHAVWGDPSVQKAWQQYRAAADPAPGYGVTEEEQIEEGVISSVGNAWSSDRAKSAWKKFTDAVWSAIKRVFGFNPPESEMAKDILVASAMLALKGNATSVNGSTVTRYSAYDQVFQEAKQVREAAAAPGLEQAQLDVIEGAASATGNLVNQSIVQKLVGMLKATMPNGSVNHVARIAARHLGFLRRYGELTQFKGGNQDTGIAHRSVLEADRDIFDSVMDLYGKLTDARAKLAAATKALAKEPMFSSVASMTNAIAKNLSDGYRDYIAAERKLAGPLSTLNGQRVNALNQTSKLLGIVRHSQPEALKKAIESIADHMPAGITDEAHLHAWLLQEKATGFPSFAPVVPPGSPPVSGVQPMNDALWEIMMMGDPANGVQPAILKSPALMGRLNDLRLIKKDKAAATKIRDNFIALMKSLNQNIAAGADKIATKQFVREYSKWIATHQAALTKATELNSDFKKAQDNVRGLMRAIQIAENVQTDPGYMAALKKASDGLNQRSRGIMTYGIHHGGARKDTLNGTVGIKNPLNSEMVWMSLSPGSEHQARNRQLAEGLIAAINVFINDPLSHPGDVRVYKDTVLPELEGVWLKANASQMLQAESNPGGLGWLVGAPFRAAGAVQHAAGNPIPGITPRSLVFPAVGGSAGSLLMEWMGRTDIAANAIRNAIANFEFGDTRQRKLNMAAAEEHGFITKKSGVYMGKDGVPASEGIRKWSMLVLNPLFASNQNPGQKHLNVGDYTPTGYKITKADMDAAKAQKRYRDYVQGQIGDSKHYQMKKRPIGREIGSRNKDDTGTMRPGYFRKETDDALKMARHISDWARLFANRFEDAATTDKQQSEAFGSTIYDAELALLASNGMDFNLAVNGWWGTSNPEYWAGYKDKVQMQVAREMSANPSPNHTFTTIEEFQNYFGERRAQIINSQAGFDKTTVDAEKVNALDTLIADIRRSVMGASMDKPFDNQVGRDAEGTGRPAAKVTSAKSELTTPRGRMMAYDSFYDYSITDDGQRMRFNAAAMIYFQKQEMEVLRAVKAGLRVELDRMNQEYAKMVHGGGMWKQALQDRAYRKAELDKVKAGELITTRFNLSHVISMLEKIENGIMNNLEEANLDDHALLALLRPMESVLSVAKLLSGPVQFGNLLSAAYLVPMGNAYTLNRGRAAVASSLLTMGKGSALLAKQLYRAASDLADSMGMGAAYKKNKKAWLGLAEVIHKSAMKRRAQMEYLQSAGFAVPESWGQGWDRFMTAVRLPETGGMVHPEGDITPIRNMLSAAARLLGTPFSALAFMGGHMTGGGEMVGAMVQDDINAQILEDLKPDIIRAFEERAKLNPNWGDTTKPIQPFLPEELGFSDARSLNALRQMFGSSGSIESIFLNFYKRAKAAGSNGINEPLMDEALMRNVRFDMQKAGNVISDSGKADALKRKGWSGASAAVLGRFMSYPLQLLPWMNRIFKVDPRDEGWKKGLRKLAALVVFMVSLGLLSMLNLGGRQVLTQMATGKVPAQSTLTSFMNDPTAGNAARTLVAGGAGVAMPFFGDPLNRLLSGQAQRPGMDLAQIVPGIGAAAEMGDFVRKVAQTRSIGQPATDLTKRLFPVTEMALNRLPGLREDLVLQNAGRAIRSAAPGDLELKSQGGGNARLTPMTPYIRRALRSAVAGDREGFETQIGQAAKIKMEMSNGRMDEQAARKAVMASVGGRNPIRLAVGRKLEPEEEARLVGGMTDAQSEAYRQAGDVFAKIGTWGGGGTGRKQKTPRTSRKGRTRGLVRSKRTTRRTRRKRSRIGW